MYEKDEKLVAFLYLLIRDKVPMGDVSQIVNDLNYHSFQFTNPHLEAMARDFAIRLTK